MRDELVLTRAGLVVAIMTGCSKDELGPNRTLPDVVSAAPLVTFLVPGGTPVTVGANGDNVIVIGQPATSLQVPGCAADATFYPVQSALLLDPGSSGKPLPLTGDFITISQTTPLHDGSRVSNLNYVNSCTANPGTPNQVSYDKYSGTMQ